MKHSSVKPKLAAIAFAVLAFVGFASQAAAAKKPTPAWATVSKMEVAAQRLSARYPVEFPKNRAQILNRIHVASTTDHGLECAPVGRRHPSGLPL